MGPRVVSLVPSITETLLAWGVDVVACTRFCEQPDLTHVGGTKNPDIDAIMRLRPDVVCMDAEENRREDHHDLVAAGLHVVTTDVVSVAGVPAALSALAAASGVEESLAEGPAAAPVTRRALVPIWRRPWMAITADTYGGSLLAALGVEVVPTAEPQAGPAGRYPVVDPAGLDVDLVLVPSEPYAFTDAHLVELRAALPAADVRRVDGQDLFWWGVRTPGARERLAAVVDGLDA